MAMSDFLENQLLDWLFRGQAISINGASAGIFTGLPNTYIGLFTTNPTDIGGYVEVSGNGYARAQVGWGGWYSTASNQGYSTGTSGIISNSSDILFPEAKTNWGFVYGLGIFDAATGGNLLMYTALPSNAGINVNKIASISSSYLRIFFD